MRRLAALVLAAALVAAVGGGVRIAATAAVAAIAVGWYLDRTAVRTGLRIGAVLAIVFAASVTAAVVAWAEGPERGIETGGMVLLRLLVLTVTAAVLVRSVDAESLLRATRRLGFERLGLVLGLALNTLPRIAEALSDVWIAARVRQDRTVTLVRRLPGLGEVLLAHTARIAEEAAAAAALRGHSALTRPGPRLQVPIRVVVVTGPTNGGKTTAAIATAETLADAGVAVAGFVQPGEYDEGAKVGFCLRDLSTGDEAPLAALGGREGSQLGTRFRFFDEGFRLGRAALARAPGSLVLIIDELGPVELRGEGHMAAVRAALTAPGPEGAVIVVRRTLVPSLLAELEASDAVVIDVEEHREDCVEAIIDALHVLP